MPLSFFLTTLPLRAFSVLGFLERGCWASFVSFGTFCASSGAFRFIFAEAEDAPCRESTFTGTALKGVLLATLVLSEWEIEARNGDGGISTKTWDLRRRTEAGVCIVDGSQVPR